MNPTVSSQRTPPLSSPVTGTPMPACPLAPPGPGCPPYCGSGAVYVWVAIALIFAVWAPSTSPPGQPSSRSNENAATGLMALSVVIPLCTRTFDLSIGFIASLTAVTASYLVTHGVVAVAVLAAMGAALVVGLVNAGVVVVMGVDWFIALRDGLADTGVHHADDQRHRDHERAARPVLQDRAGQRRARHAAGVLHPGRRGADLVRAPAHRHRAAALRDRLQPGKRAPGRRADGPGSAPSP